MKAERKKKEVVSFENVNLNPDESLNLLERLAKNQLTEEDLIMLFQGSEKITLKEN